MASFSLTVQATASIHPDGEPSDFITEYDGVLYCCRDEDGKVTKVGRVHAYRLHADLAANAGESLFDVCDCHSQWMADLYGELFDHEDNDLRPDVRDQFDGFDADLLILDYVVLRPKWRGLRVGLLAARKLVDLLGGGCALVVADIAPLRPDAHDMLRVPQSWLPRHRTK